MNAAQYGENAEQARVLTRVLWAEADRLRISDEDAERLLAPLKKRIMAGEFTRAPKHGYVFRLAISLAAALILAASLAQP